MQSIQSIVVTPGTTIRFPWFVRLHAARLHHLGTDDLATPIGGVLQLAGEATWTDDPATVTAACIWACALGPRRRHRHHHPVVPLTPHGFHVAKALPPIGYREIR